MMTSSNSSHEYEPLPPEDNQTVESDVVSQGTVGSMSRFRKNRKVWISVLVVMPALVWGYCRPNHKTRDALIHRCQELQAEQNWGELRNCSDRLSNLDPTSSVPWIYKAAACEAVGDFECMIASIDRIPEQDSRFSELQLRKMTVLFKDLNRPWDALKTCDHILNVNPLVMLAHEESITFCLLTLQRAELVRRIRRAINCRRERPEDYVFLVSVNWLNHAAVYTANSFWVKTNRTEVFQVAQAIPVYLSSAKTGDQADRFVDVPSLEELSSRYPENIELLNYLIQASIDYGNMKGAEALLARVPKTNEAEKDARFWRARALCEDSKGDLSATAENLQKAFQCDPYWWKVHYELHDVYRRLEKTELADRFLKIYEVGRPLAESISVINHYQNSEHPAKNYSFSNKILLKPILTIAEMIDDRIVVNAIKQRIEDQSQN